MKANIFDIDVLISVSSMVWFVDKTNPNYPLFKINMSDFNLIKSGIYKSQNNRVDFNGDTFWLPNELSSKLKVISKNKNIDFPNIVISLQEFLNPDLIDKLEYNILWDNIKHLKNKQEDIYIICSKEKKKNYKLILDKMVSEFNNEGLNINGIYYLSETFYSKDNDDILFNKIKLLLQHLVGYKTHNNIFIDEEIKRYDIVEYYDNSYDTLNIINLVNKYLQLMVDRVDGGLREVISENIKHYAPLLYVTKVNTNKMNRLQTEKVNILLSRFIKTFENFLNK